MYFTYVLRSRSSGRFYVGSTEDFPRRLAQHQAGVARYTRGRGPWDIVLIEEFPTRSEAMRRERALKSGQGRAWLKEHLDGGASRPQAE